MQADLEVALREIYALRRLGWKSEAFAINWAVQALVSGHDTLHLRVLAGLDLFRTSSHEIDVTLELIFKDLGLEPPSVGDAASWLLRHIASEIVDGVRPCDKGAADIYRLAMRSGESDLLRDWSLICDDLHPATLADLSSRGFDDIVREYAGRIVAAV